VREFKEYLRLSASLSSYPVWYRWVFALVGIPAFVGVSALEGTKQDIAFGIFCLAALPAGFIIFRKVGIF